MVRLDDVLDHRLSNGLHVLLVPESSCPTIAISLTYRAGSRHEQHGESGIAHLLEHLMFAGTHRVPRLLEACADRGIRVNGNTSTDRTTYLAIMAANADNLRWVVGMEADRMVNGGFGQDDLDRERGVILSELAEVENHGVRLLGQRVAAAAYRWHNYRRPVIGAVSDLAGIDPAAVRRFYERFYRPDNATLTIAGRIDVSATLDMIAANFGDIPRPSSSPPVAATLEPPQDGERQVTLRRAGGEHLIMTAFHVPAARHPDFPAVVTLSRLLSDEPSGRLRAALVATDLASSVVTDTAYSHDPGLMTHIATLPKNKILDAARGEMMRALDGLEDAPVTDEEVERARGSFMKYLARAHADCTRVAMSIGHYIGAGDWTLGFLHQEQVHRLTTADVQRAAGQYVHWSNRTVGVLASDKAPRLVQIPAAPPAAERAARRTAHRREPERAGGAAVTVARNEERLTRHTLRSGHKVVLCPGRPHGERVSICIRLHHGDETTLFGKAQTAEAVACLLTRGTADLHGLALKDALDRLDARVMARGGPMYAQLIVDAAPAHAAETVKLIGSMIREPHFRLGDLDDWRRTRCVATENARHDPRQTAESALKRCLNPYPNGDPRYVPLPEERLMALGALTIEELREFHRQFLGASFGASAIVGWAEETGIEAALEQVFGDWSNATASTWPGPVFRPPEAANLTIPVSDRGNAHLMAALPVPISHSHPAYPALVAATYIIGGSLTSRLVRRLRHEERLSYIAGADFSDTPLSDRNVFMAYAMSTPRDVLRAEQLLVAELDDALRDGFSESEVELAKAGVIRTRQSERANDRGLAQALATDAAFDLDPGRAQWFQASVNALSADALQAAFRAYVDTSRLTIVKAGDLVAPSEYAKLQAPTPSTG